MADIPRLKLFIKEWRKAKGLTTQQLAERLDVSEPSLSRIESGHSGVTVVQIETMAAALGMEPMDLFKPPQ